MIILLEGLTCKRPSLACGVLSREVLGTSSSSTQMEGAEGVAIIHRIKKSVNNAAVILGSIVRDTVNHCFASVVTFTNHVAGLIGQMTTKARHFLPRRTSLRGKQGPNHITSCLFIYSSTRRHGCESSVRYLRFRDNGLWFQGGGVKLHGVSS